ncbi:hypothetical protein [Flavobacterium aquicola]|uniref:Uncharacterized protein n=1 Tax=Flavobacterium aquicola TaxID=1682742 RepID=A0A3E0ESX6_9FLAO|nr:hypothetical protein [Flavobacterium aquicola]REH00267.1 hypothetical protein C8P67_103243 [Flavobacterium aquicola]
MSEFDELFKLAVNGSRNNKRKGKFTLTVGTVKAVEGDTCTVDNYEDVRLNAIIEDTNSQFTVYPKLGSKVIIGRLENEDNAFVVGVSEIEKLIIKIDNQVFEMKDGKFTIKSGNISLKSILNDGFDQLGKAIIMTPSGPGKFSAADKLVFADLKDKTNQLLS